MSPPLSIFDVDRTLTRRPTYSLFLLFAARRTAPWRLLLVPGLLLPLARYRLGRISRERLKEAMHALLLGRRMPRALAERLGGEFAGRLVADGLYAQAVACIRAEQAAGRRVILATAAPMLYMVPLARHLGIADIVATRGRWVGDRLDHRINGANCYGPAKLTMIRALLEADGVRRQDVHVRFHSDHISDLPTFEWADEPVAANPSPRLRALARARGWRIVDWGDRGAGV